MARASRSGGMVAGGIGTLAGAGGVALAVRRRRWHGVIERLLPPVLLHGVTGSGGYGDEIVTFGMLVALLLGLAGLSLRGRRRRSRKKRKGAARRGGQTRGGGLG